MGSQHGEDIVGEIGAAPTCRACGSERVVRDAWACWNPATGLWELETTFDQEFCHVCEAETHFVWKRVERVPSQRIRELNDRFRQHGRGRGSVMVTPGVQIEGQAFVLAAYKAIREFSDFSADNDPWGEHDFGTVAIDGKAVFWKIDYYDPTITVAASNPANEGDTHRILTILMPSEY